MSPAGYAFIVLKYAATADRAIAHLRSRLVVIKDPE